MAFRKLARQLERRPARRTFLKAIGATTLGALAGLPAGAGAEKPARPDGDTYATHAKGIRILPGQWRPHYPFEQIAWISPPWSSQDYIWLDFPEAIFTSRGLLYLSHVNPRIPSMFSELPRVPWRQISSGLAFDRELPNGVAFGGSVKKGTETTVDLELHIRNGSTDALSELTLQTCAFLRAIKEFSDFTRDNKLVHTARSGWVPIPRALEAADGSGSYRIGWRGGKAVADWPVLVTVSNQAERLVAMTWHENTLSLISNPLHPCMHADPRFKDLSPGDEASIRGKLIFFAGKLDDFDPRNYGRG